MRGCGGITKGSFLKRGIASVVEEGERVGRWEDTIKTYFHPNAGFDVNRFLTLPRYSAGRAVT